MALDRKWRLAGLLLALWAGILSNVSARDLTGQDAQIRTLLDSFVAAWDRHDADGVAERFAVDADCSDPWGSTVLGREQIRQMAGDKDGFFATTRFVITGLSIRFVSGDAALVTLSGRITGLSPESPSAATDENIHLVVSRREDRWWIASIRSYDSAPPMSARARIPALNSDSPS